MRTLVGNSARWLGAILLLLGGVGAVQAQDANVRDLTFEREGQALVITYDLLGEEGEEYEVTLLYSSSGGDVFDYEPKAVTGDVGEDIRPGLDKRIVWSVLEDFPSGIQSPAVQFKVVAEEQGGGWGWFFASLFAGSGGTAAGIATGVLPCFSFIPGQVSNTLCPAAGGGGNGGGENGGSDSLPPIPEPTGPPPN